MTHHWTRGPLERLFLSALKNSPTPDDRQTLPDDVLLDIARTARRPTRDEFDQLLASPATLRRLAALEQQLDQTQAQSSAEMRPPPDEPATRQGPSAQVISLRDWMERRQASCWNVDVRLEAAAGEADTFSRPSDDGLWVLHFDHQEDGWQVRLAWHDLDDEDDEDLHEAGKDDMVVVRWGPGEPVLSGRLRRRRLRGPWPHGHSPLEHLGRYPLAPISVSPDVP